MKNIRTIVVHIVLGSFSIAALFGIIALLAGGIFDGTPSKVLMTTLIVGAESIAVLCYLSTADTKYSSVGVVGGLISLVPTGMSLWWVWSDPYDVAESVWKASGIGITVAASTAQACLLLAVAGDAQPRVRRMLRASLLAILIVAVMIIVPIVDGDDLGDLYWRSFGVIAILDVLGTITVAALAKFGVKHEQSAVGPLAPVLQQRITSEAARRGLSPDELVNQALDALP